MFEDLRKCFFSFCFLFFLGKLPKGIYLICEAFLNSSLRKREFCLPEGEREREESQSSIARFSHTTLKTEEEEEEKQEENNNNKS
jgi:hypothetical protein